MDSALILKQKFDSGEIKDFEQAQELLKDSQVVKELLTDFDFDIINLLNRLSEFTEIPFANKIGKVQGWLRKLAEVSCCEDGFSITGQSDDILSCYNSMITSILIRMNFQDPERILRGVDWILNYQNIERNQENKWKGSRALKYGGCMKETPCYIGVVKATIALSDYKNHPNYIPNKQLEAKLNSGLEYILNHQLFKRKSSGEPITKYITKFSYPFSYKTNVVEIMRLLKANSLETDPRCSSAKEYLLKKKDKNGFWKVNSMYLPKFWVYFDKPKEAAYWISYEIEKVLRNYKKKP